MSQDPSSSGQGNAPSNDAPSAASPVSDADVGLELQAVRPSTPDNAPTVDTSAHGGDESHKEDYGDIPVLKGDTPRRSRLASGTSQASLMSPVLPRSPDLAPRSRRPSLTGHVALPDVELGGGAPDSEDEEEVKPVRMCLGVNYATKHYHVLPYPPQHYWADRKQVLNEVLAGITVALAQLSDSIAFSFIAGVGPLLGLHAAWIIGITLSLFGSRPAMINGATGVRAAVIAPYVKSEGIGMLFYIVCAISVFQALGALFRVAKLVRLVPRPAMIGFVNGLAIILALGQIGQFQHPNTDIWLDADVVVGMGVLVMTTVLASIYLPKIPKVGGALPPSLLGVLAATIVDYAILRPAIGIDTPTIGDSGNLEGGFPKLFFLDDQYDGLIPTVNWDTIKKTIAPGFIAAAAGMVEAVMTMEVVNDLTETNNPNPNQQLLALSVGNFLSALFGTMGGGATIGPSIICCTNGANGQYRISGVVAGVSVFLMVLVATPLISRIPTASMVGVMVIVCVATFEWSSLPVVGASLCPMRVRTHSCFRNVKRKIKRSDAIVIVLVTIVTLVMDLFTAVAAGIMFTAAAYAWERGHELRAEETTITNPDGSRTKVIHVIGDVFFASTTEVSVSRCVLVSRPRGNSSVRRLFGDSCWLEYGHALATPRRWRSTFTSRRSPISRACTCLTCSRSSTRVWARLCTFGTSTLRPPSCCARRTTWLSTSATLSTRWLQTRRWHCKLRLCCMLRSRALTCGRTAAHAVARAPQAAPVAPNVVPEQRPTARCSRGWKVYNRAAAITTHLEWILWVLPRRSPLSAIRGQAAGWARHTD